MLSLSMALEKASAGVWQPLEGVFSALEMCNYCIIWRRERDKKEKAVNSTAGEGGSEEEKQLWHPCGRGIANIVSVSQLRAEGFEEPFLLCSVIGLGVLGVLHWSSSSAVIHPFAVIQEPLGWNVPDRTHPESIYSPYSLPLLPMFFFCVFRQDWMVWYNLSYFASFPTAVISLFPKRLISLHYMN